eukprot:9750034-Alexandrium_andersonii.AAC.1
MPAIDACEGWAWRSGTMLGNDVCERYLRTALVGDACQRCLMCERCPRPMPANGADGRRPRRMPA